MLLHLDERTLCNILRYSCIAPIPSHFESKKSQEIKDHATSFQTSCILVFKRLRDLATTCRFFRISAWEGFIELVALLSENTSWTYSGGEQGQTESLMGTAAVYFARIHWISLLEGVGLWVKKVDEFFKRKELLEEIKGLKRDLEVALEELTFFKRQRKCI
jgi:hypothetical protein